VWLEGTTKERVVIQEETDCLSENLEPKGATSFWCRDDEEWECKLCTSGKK